MMAVCSIHCNNFGTQIKCPQNQYANLKTSQKFIYKFELNKKMQNVFKCNYISNGGGI